MGVSQSLDLAGSPSPSPRRDGPLQLCQAVCSLLERAVLTLWFLWHCLWASEGGQGGSLLALGGSLALGFQRGWEIILCFGSFNFFRGEIFSTYSDSASAL